MIDASRIPVIIGVGQINDRPGDLGDGLDSEQLMEAALRAADEDAGGGWLKRIDSLGVVEQVSFPDLHDVPNSLRERIGSPRARTTMAPASGDSPILLLNLAANAIAAGEIQIAAIAGGEGIKTAARRAAASDSAGESVTVQLGRKRRPAHVQKYGLITPIDIYPLYENATRARWAQSLAESQAESGEIWSRFSEVAAANPSAWVRQARSPNEIVQTSRENRMLAFPYNKFMVANSSVNQGAAFIVTSLAAARERGISPDRLAYVGHGAAAQEPADFLKRDSYDRSTAMEASLLGALRENELRPEDLDHVELYSCFPCIPKMARRVIDWPFEKPATVSGGLTFAGGPLGNYMSHAVASMVSVLRSGGRTGLLFANGGLATKFHSLVLMREAPRVSLAREFDVQPEADERRGPIPALLDHYAGEGRIETYTVFYERDGSPRDGVVIGRTAAGERFLAKVTDRAAIDLLTNGETEPVGATGEAIPGADGLTFWRMS